MVTQLYDATTTTVIPTYKVVSATIARHPRSLIKDKYNVQKIDKKGRVAALKKFRKHGIQSGKNNQMIGKNQDV
jgi:hypothetical protein